MAVDLNATRTYLAGVLAKLPESLRAQAEAVFNDAAAAQALEDLGAGVKRQDEFSRAMDQLRIDREKAQALYDSNKTWYEQNAEEVRQAAALRARLAELEAGGDPDPTPKPTPKPDPTAPPVTAPNTVTRDELTVIARETLALLGELPTKAVQHFATFGEVLPVKDLLMEAQTRNCTVEEAYQAKYGARLKEKADAAEAARVQAIKDEAIAEFRRANPSMPYPSPRAQSGSPLDGLSKDPSAPETSVADIEAFYNDLVAAKSGASA